MPKEIRLNLVGQKFNRLLVIADAGNNKWKKSLWKCICDCGNRLIVLGCSLKSGRTKSCGCYNREKVSETRRSNLVGQKFNRLLVIADVGNNKWGSSLWLCKCDCGIEKVVIGDNLKRGCTKSCGCLRSAAETRQKISEAAKLRTGENGSNYRHGLKGTKAYNNQINAKHRALKKSQMAANYDTEKVACIYRACRIISQSGNEEYQVDHWHPLTKGGEHGQDNMQILLKTLNGEKHNKWPLTEEERIRYKGITLKDLERFTGVQKIGGIE